MRDVGSKRWEREVNAMHTAGLHTMILQWTQAEGKNLFEPPDPFAQLLDIAHRRKMRVVFGLRHDERWWHEWGSAVYLREEAKQSVTLAREVFLRYGKHPAFAGSYIPYEIWDAPFTETQAAQIGELLATIGHACRQMAPGKPVLLAPFFAGLLPPERFEQLRLSLLKERPVDVVALQDGVGARAGTRRPRNGCRPIFPPCKAPAGA